MERMQQCPYCGKQSSDSTWDLAAHVAGKHHPDDETYEARMRRMDDPDGPGPSHYRSGPLGEAERRRDDLRRTNYNEYRRQHGGRARGKVQILPKGLSKALTKAGKTFKGAFRSFSASTRNVTVPYDADEDTKSVTTSIMSKAERVASKRGDFGPSYTDERGRARPKAKKPKAKRRR